MRLDETSAICRSLINNLKPRNVKVNYMVVQDYETVFLLSN